MRGHGHQRRAQLICLLADQLPHALSVRLSAHDAHMVWHLRMQYHALHADWTVRLEFCDPLVVSDQLTSKWGTPSHRAEQIAVKDTLLQAKGYNTLPVSGPLGPRWHLHKSICQMACSAEHALLVKTTPYRDGSMQPLLVQLSSRWACASMCSHLAAGIRSLACSLRSLRSIYLRRMSAVDYRRRRMHAQLKQLQERMPNLEICCGYVHAPWRPPESEGSGLL